MDNSIGYGPRAMLDTRYGRLRFSGNDQDFEAWEEVFLGHMRRLKMKSVILPAQDGVADPEDFASKNEEAYAELIQFLDPRSLALVMREARDDGRAALAVLRHHYRRTRETQVISMYYILTTLIRSPDEQITDYIIRAETAFVNLKSAGETVSEKLLMAMIMKGLGQDYKMFCMSVKQRETSPTFKEFKELLRCCEVDLRDGKKESVAGGDSVFKMQHGSGGNTCYNCGQDGHYARGCVKQKAPNSGENSENKGRGKKKSMWCEYCKKATHDTKRCFSKKKAMKKGQGINSIQEKNNEDMSQGFHFMVSENQNSVNLNRIEGRSYLIDSGATSHLSNCESDFCEFDESFKTSDYPVTLADGRVVYPAEKKGKVKLSVDVHGKTETVMLSDVLFMPKFPISVISMSKTTEKGAKYIFSEEKNILISPTGDTLPLVNKNNLYYLPIRSQSNTEAMFMSQARTLRQWHEILGHCNFDSIRKLELQNPTMKIKGDKSNFDCDICLKTKLADKINKAPSENQPTKPLERVHADLAGPITPNAIDGFNYAINFVDAYSGLTVVYFLKGKTDIVKAVSRYLADVANIGTVKTMRTDNGLEFICKEVKEFLDERSIRHETSSPNSPHQNSIAERSWRTLFETARAMMSGGNVAKNLWTYALKYAVFVRNRCHKSKLDMSPFECATGRKPVMNNLLTFGQPCFAYDDKQYHQKLDDRAVSGIFLGFDQNSPAYLIKLDKDGKIMKFRHVRGIESVPTSVSRESSPTLSLDERFYRYPPINAKVTGERGSLEDVAPVPMEEKQLPTQPVSVDVGTEERYNEEVSEQEIDVEPKSERPQRNRQRPEYLKDYVTLMETQSMIYCYNVVCEIPNSYQEAINSPESEHWKGAMENELESLKRHDVYTEVQPPSRGIVDGKWVFSKKDSDSDIIYKARYVARGFSQTQGVDFHETFAPTAKLTTLRLLVQIAVNYDFHIVQYDVKTAFLNAPIAEDIYVKPPPGYSNSDYVWKLKKSLYGLKQSSKNWNDTLHEFLIENDFKNSEVDSCLYTMYNKDKIVGYILVWVDDILAFVNEHETARKLTYILKQKFEIKELGNVSTFLGIRFDIGIDYVTIHQEKYICKILERFGMSSCKARVTPMESEPFNTKLSPDDMAQNQNNYYREIIGSLIYLMQCTRPDLAFCVTKLSQYLDKYDSVHMGAAKHVLRYLCGTKNVGITYRKVTNKNSIFGYTDADWANSPDRKSVSGYVFFLGDKTGAISWKSKKQNSVALSSCEAEYMAMSLCAQEGLFLSNLLKELLLGNGTFTMFVDNQGAIHLSKNRVVSQRSKHISIKYHFLRDLTLSKRMIVTYVPTDENIADMCTKALARVKLVKFRDMACNCN